MREQLSPESTNAGTFVHDQTHSCYANTDDMVDTVPSWCPFCVSQHRQSRGTAQASNDVSSRGHREYEDNVDESCLMFPIRVEVVRETILEILLGIGIADYRRCASDVETALRFEATLRSMVRAATRQNPGTTAFSYDHLLRRFVPDEWS